MTDNSKKKSRKTSLKKKMIYYFLLIAIANIFVAGEIIYEIKSHFYLENIKTELSLLEPGTSPAQLISNIMDKLAKKFVIMVLILTIVSAVILFLFVIQIAAPLQYLIDKAEKISNGDLSIKIDIKTNDEIAELGWLINDLSVNMQEVVAQLKRMIDQLEKIIALHKENIYNNPEMGSCFEEETEAMTAMLNELTLLNQYYILFSIENLIKNIELE